MTFTRSKSRQWLIVLVLVFGALASAQTSAFKAGKLSPGSWFHYTKSNLDGSHKGHFYIYTVDGERFEVLKLEPGAADGVYITARMDWGRFSETDLAMTHIRRGDERRKILQAKIEDGEFRMYLEPEQKMLKPPFALPNPMARAIKGEPIHVYGFELIGLNLTLPHLRRKNADFSVELIGDNPAFGPDDPNVMMMFGRLKVSHVGAMPMNGVNCRLYRLSGPALDGQEGQMWVDKKTGMIVRLESPKANNGDWKSLLLELKESRKMTLDEWRQWMRDEAQRHIARAEAAAN